MAKRPTSPKFLANKRAVTALRAARRAGQDAEIELRRLDKTDEADKVWEKTQLLTTQIDVLIGRMMEAWTAEAAALTRVIADAQARAQAAVNRLKQNQKIAQQVVSILGALDDAIGIAAKFLVL